jgi:hypothetical protein
LNASARFPAGQRAFLFAAVSAATSSFVAVAGRQE